MGVAYVSDADSTGPGSTVTSFAFTSYAISGTNPAVAIGIGLSDNTISVSSVVCSAGLTCADQGNGANNGLGVVAQNAAGSNNTRVEIWSLAAPSGTGTITVTFSGAVQYQANALLFSGADQATPCPAADATGTTGATNPLSVTPANLTANDAVVGFGANANDGDAPTFQQTQTFNNNTTIINAAGGYHLGTGAVSVSWGSPVAIDVMVAARVVAAASGPLSLSSKVDNALVRPFNMSQGRR